MNKAFTKESDAPDDDDEGEVAAPPIPAGTRRVKSSGPARYQSVSCPPSGPSTIRSAASP